MTNPSEKRVIKFRAWSKNEKRMEYPDINCIVPVGVLTGHGDISTLFSCDWELQQFTGLIDKNDKEIYEGDIVRTPKIPDIRIYWSNKDGAFMGEYLEEVREIYDCHINDSCNIFSEIIGNIYENPELLK